jgi:hypothetical protein
MVAIVCSPSAARIDAGSQSSIDARMPSDMNPAEFQQIGITKKKRTIHEIS